MRKIKNFKISIKAREVSRMLRKLLNIEELTIEQEEAVQKACFFYNKTIKPAVIYDTISKETMVWSFDIETPEKWIAVSPYIVTIGNELQEEFNKNQEQFGAYTVQIVSAISANTLEQSKNFIQKILTEDAKDEYCELSRNIEIPNNLYPKICEMLPTDKINVSLLNDEENQTFKFNPTNTITGLFYWIPVKRRTKK